MRIAAALTLAFVPASAALSQSAASPEGVAHVRWNISREADIPEYRVMRGETPEGPWTLVETVPGQGAGVHGPQSYRVVDRGLEVGRVYHYMIEHENAQGRTLHAGPISYTAQTEAEAASQEASPEAAASPAAP